MARNERESIQVPERMLTKLIFPTALDDVVVVVEKSFSAPFEFSLAESFPMPYAFSHKETKRLPTKQLILS